MRAHVFGALLSVLAANFCWATPVPGPKIVQDVKDTAALFSRSLEVDLRRARGGHTVNISADVVNSLAALNAVAEALYASDAKLGEMTLSSAVELAIGQAIEAQSQLSAIEALNVSAYLRRFEARLQKRVASLKQSNADEWQWHSRLMGTLTASWGLGMVGLVAAINGLNSVSLPSVVVTTGSLIGLIIENVRWWRFKYAPLPLVEPLVGDCEDRLRMLVRNQAESPRS